MIVSVQICPDGSIGIEIFAAMNVAQDGAMTFGDDERLALEPVAHLGERMPDEPAVELGGLVHGSKGLGQWSELLLSAKATCEISSGLCAAVIVTRKRARPRATVG
jgi:hypothetical protein